MRTPSKHTRESAPLPAMPSIPREAVFSFLKETKGLSDWTSRDLAKTLNISDREAKQVLPVLEMQGYVRSRQNHDQWFTTPAGEAVSGAKFPRFKIASVQRALSQFSEQLAANNRDSASPFKVAKAVAFGDFLSARPQVQAADVGLQLEPRNPRAPDSASKSTTADAQRLFLRQLRPKGALIHLHLFEPWMETRTHSTLFPAQPASALSRSRAANRR